MMKLSQSDLELIAKVVYAEGSVFVGKNTDALLGIAQCIYDLFATGNYKSLQDCLSQCFTTPSDILDTDCLDAVRDVFMHNKRRFSDKQILQFRSFKYSDGKSHLDEEKVKDLLSQYDYLGCDSISDKWGHFYFGKDNSMKDFKMLLISGHGRNVNGTWDPGACGNGYQEANLTRELVELVKSEADKRGITCDVAPNRNHFDYFKNGGTYDVTGYNYVLEIHFNSSSNKDVVGDGSVKGSMFYIDETETGHTVEDAILQNLYNLGSRKAWDGVVVAQRQYPAGLLVQRTVRNQGVSHGLLETCFVSDADDMAWYQNKKKEIAKVIIDGIVKGFGLKVATVPYMVKVAIDDLNIRTNPGIAHSIVAQTGKGVFTIVEEKLGTVDAKGNVAKWGLLKSYQAGRNGWICLDYVTKV